MKAMTIPVIGIGAGPATDGQVLVFHDLLGIFAGHAPKFVKRFAELREQMIEGVADYAREVRARELPARRARLLDRCRRAGGVPQLPRAGEPREARASSAGIGRRLRSEPAAGGWQAHHRKLPAASSEPQVTAAKPRCTSICNDPHEYRADRLRRKAR